VRRFRFALQHENQLLGLPIGQHIMLSTTEKDEPDDRRPYTPTSSDDNRGFVDFVIKVYRPFEPNFPNGGMMSQHLDNMKIGDKIWMAGPVGDVEYLGSGRVKLSPKRKTPVFFEANKIGMVAGGTGITPMLQVIRAILKNPRDRTKIWLIFANKTEDDVLLRDELEGIAKAQPDRFKLWLTLDNPPAGWAQGKGFISEEMCRDHLPPQGPSTLVFNCGPPVCTAGLFAQCVAVIPLLDCCFCPLSHSPPLSISTSTSGHDFSGHRAQPDQAGLQGQGQGGRVDQLLTHLSLSLSSPCSFRLTISLGACGGGGGGSAFLVSESIVVKMLRALYSPHNSGGS
jgi:cytochrome-b5 reductase